MTGHSLHHVGIVVPKRETVEAILPLLGLSLGVSQWVPEYQAECLFTAGEGTRLEFIIPRGGKLAEFQQGRGGLHHVAIEVPDLDALMARLRQAGVEFVDSQPVEAGDLRICFLPPVYTRGFTVEFVERKRSAA